MIVSDASLMARRLRTAARIVRPPPSRTADEWADAERVLPPESPEPGPWRTSRVPYMVAPMRAASDPRYSTIILVCGAQMAKTETILCVLGHRFVDGPYVPAMYVGPTEKQVRTMSGDRFRKMIQSTPVLLDRLEKGHRDKVTEKYIAGVRLGFAWAGSATELSSHPIGLCVVDERDRMVSDVGGEGDPVELARARLKNYPAGKLIICSTPTIEAASPIWSLYEEGTMHKWAWSCPHCSVWFVPRLELLRWPKDCSPSEAAATARVVCPSCGAEIDSSAKPALNRDGRYIAHAVNDDGEHVPLDDERPNATASYWISGLASPWRTFGQSAEVMVRAYRSGEQERIQAALNTEFGELYRAKGDAPAWDEVAKQRQGYRPPEIPDGVQVITMGVDVQKRGLYYVIRGWGFNSESWLIRHGYIAGETEYDSVWVLLASVQAELYRGGTMALKRAFIDSGYRPGDKWKRPENAIYMHCRRHHGLAFPTKGHDQQDRPIKASDIDVSVGGRTIKGGVKLWHLDTDHLKSWIFARIRWPDDQPGGWHLHADADEDYCRQIVSEELLIKPSGKRIWLRRSRDNHYLDAEVNALAAAMSLQVHALPQVASAKVPAGSSPPPLANHPDPPRQNWNGPKRESWFRR